MSLLKASYICKSIKLFCIVYFENAENRKNTHLRIAWGIHVYVVHHNWPCYWRLVKTYRYFFRELIIIG